MWHDITLPCTYVSLTIRSFNNTYVNTYLDDIRHETKMMSLVACAYCTTCIRVRRTRAFGYLRSHTQWPHMRPIDLEVDEAVAPFGDLGTRTRHSYKWRAVSYKWRATSYKWRATSYKWCAISSVSIFAFMSYVCSSLPNACVYAYVYLSTKRVCMRMFIS